MANKKITDLTLISAVTDSVNLPSDDTIQSYRLTFAQIWTWLLGKLQSTVTISAAGTTLLETNKIVFLNPTGGSFSQALPAVAGCSGWLVTFKNVATNGNTATLDASGTELIDAAETIVLASTPTMDAATLYCNGVKWLIL